MNLFKLTIIFAAIHSTICGRLKERYGPIPEHFVLKVLTPMATKIEGMPKIPLLGQMFPRLNLSIHSVLNEPSIERKLGSLINESSCTYDGFIGSVQRNQMNIFTQFARLDAFACEPGFFMILTELDDTPKIFSRKQIATKPDLLDILYAWVNFPPEVWIYIVTLLIMTSILFVAIVMVLSDGGQSIKKLVKLFVATFWDYLMLFYDLAPTTIMPQASAIVLWTSICVAMLYAFHNVFFGLFSTDLVLVAEPRSIETLQDLLFDPEFNHTKPVIFTQLNMYDTLKYSPPGSDERVLFDKINGSGDSGMIYMSGDNVQQMGPIYSRLMNDTIHGKIAIIENSKFVMLGLEMACAMATDFVNSLTVSTEVILPSPMTMLLSLDTPIPVKMYMEDRLSFVQEAGIIRGTVRNSQSMFLEQMAKEVTIEGLICSSKFEGTYQEDLDLPFEALSLDPFKRFLRICVSAIAVASILMVSEVLYWRLNVMYHETKATRERRRAALRSFLRERITGPI